MASRASASSYHDHRRAVRGFGPGAPRQSMIPAVALQFFSGRPAERLPPLFEVVEVTQLRLRIVPREPRAAPRVAKPIAKGRPRAAAITK